MMKALVFGASGHAEVRQLPYPEPGPGEITIRVKRSGVCGTDLHIFHGGRPVSFPFVPGHEFAGVVDKVGPDVHLFKMGDRVAVDPTLFCGTCANCLGGMANHCLRKEELRKRRQGAMAEFVKVPERNVYAMPDGMSYEEASFAEPMACIVHALNRLQLKSGQRVVLFGVGSMGQLFVQALSRFGVAVLIVSDVSAAKMSLALQYGATGVLQDRNMPAIQGGGAVPNKFDVVIDTTGIPSLIERQFEYLDQNGTFLQFGVAPVQAVISIRPYDIFNNDWKIIGSMAVNNTFKPALDWIGAKRFELHALVTRVLTIDEAPGFFMGGKSNEEIKVQICFE